MKKRYIITVITSILMVVLIAGIQKIILEKKESRFVRVGALYVGDSSNTYTGNFIKAQKAIEKKFGNQVEFIPMFNVLEGNCENSLQILVFFCIKNVTLFLQQVMVMVIWQKNLQKNILIFSFVMQQEIMQI